MSGLPSLNWTDLADIALVSIFIWAAIIWIRRSRARAALSGLAILGVVYLLARTLGLGLTASILQGFFAVLVLILVVVFQEELRRIFERIGALGFRRRRRSLLPAVVDLLAGAVRRLVASGTGALIVLPGRDPLDRHLRGGSTVDAVLSEPLLLSLFDPHSPGHDGAVIVDNGRVVSFAVHLPLSTDQARLGSGGTRHAAALGLAERSDALVVVVSEERGTVSLAHDGELRPVADPGELTTEIQSFLERIAPPLTGRARWGRAAVRLPEALLALVLGTSAWLLTASGLDQKRLERTATVVVEEVPAGFVVESIEPAEVTVTLSGPRRRVIFGNTDDLTVRIDGRLVELGRRTFRVSPAQVEPPPGLSVVSVEPGQVRLSVRAPGASPSGDRTPADR